ncbi:ATPase AAA [Candidatus Acidianus copahuensis]|uniref:ATPase AAA n=1 Tax=Candidatus Acidianus copahuensis TaxID=1160895 RepID=A0A031LLC8_9CREN|nr:ATPase AAA [Candidatus Acidianus copahuensis]
MSDFIFERGNFISLYGASGSGKTVTALQVIKDSETGLFISTNGSIYRERVKTMNISKAFFIEVGGILELLNAVMRAISMELQPIIVDDINTYYRISGKSNDLLYPLSLLKEYSKYAKVLILWQMSFNNRVSGEKFMRYFSDDILRITKTYIIGNMRRIKICITNKGVDVCR